jgi:hypothetical protein
MSLIMAGTNGIRSKISDMVYDSYIAKRSDGFGYRMERHTEPRALKAACELRSTVSAVR